MKKIILYSLFLSCLPVLAETPAPTPTTSSTGNAPAQSAEKNRALEIRDLLVSTYKSGDANQATWDSIETKIGAYQKDFSSDPATKHNMVLLRNMELTVAKKVLDPAGYQALAQKLAADPQPEVAAMATEQIAVQKRMDDLKSKPIDLKFAAVDGTAVDLAKLRGKVVLIDFWATWCPMCREEVPDVVAAYKKYHDQGFEIVGISLDHNKDAMLAFTKGHGMVWPQYFDGLGWNNTVSKSFGIHSIPAMWLVDKKGMLVITEQQGDLAGQVDKLLREP